MDANGFKALDPAKTKEVLDFYKAIAKASPPGELFWKQSRELYFAGKAAMIIWVAVHSGRTGWPEGFRSADYQ